METLGVFMRRELNQLSPPGGGADQPAMKKTNKKTKALVSSEDGL